MIVGVWCKAASVLTLYCVTENCTENWQETWIEVEFYLSTTLA